MLRLPAVAGSWYPADSAVLARDVDDYLLRAARAPSAGRVRAIVAPHAGLMYSGAIAGAAYAAVRGASYDAVVLVGPSHYVPFEGVAAWPDGAFDTPLGAIPVAAACVQRLVACAPIVTVRTDAHRREHSLEMQLPFVARALAGVPIVPLVMGAQTRETVDALGAALADAFAGQQILLAASSDLSHFFDAPTAATLDGHVADLVAAFDADGLMLELDRYPEYERGRYVACGGGPLVAVMHAARRLGASTAYVLARSHSGQVSGDLDRVVGYMAAAFVEGPERVRTV
jgi:AmmeMemoRadiSam system protein B